MGKQAEKRIALAKIVLETEDVDKLNAVEAALIGAPPAKFSEAEINEFEKILDRIERGEERTYSWSEVKQKALRGRRK